MLIKSTIIVVHKSLLQERNFKRKKRILFINLVTAVVGIILNIDLE